MAVNAGNEAIELALGQAASRLRAKGVLMAGGILSARIPEQSSFVSLLLPNASQTAMSFRWTSLRDTPADLHHRIYAARPDVGAIAAGTFKWTSTLARLNVSLPAVFDEQVRHLGVGVRRVAMRSTDKEPIPALANGANAYMFDDMMLCFGMGMERLLPNIEILEKCAESFLLAHCAAQPVERIPWLVRFIANGRLKKDQKDAAAQHLRGERAVMKAGY